MKVLVLFAAVVIATQAQRLCQTPDQWEGFAVTLDPLQGEFGVAAIHYDLTNQREAFEEEIVFANRTRLRIGQILLYNSRIGYEINIDAKTCTKFTLRGYLRPLGVLNGSHYEGAATVGIEPVLGGYVDTQIWRDDFRQDRHYAGIFTVSQCIPILEYFANTEANLWYHTSLYDVTLGIKDEKIFTPPSFC